LLLVVIVGMRDVVVIFFFNIIFDLHGLRKTEYFKLHLEILENILKILFLNIILN